MGQLMQLLRAATSKADHAQFEAWFKHKQPIAMPDIASSKQFTATKFQSRLTEFNRMHDWQHPYLHPCFPQLLGLPQHIEALADKHSPFPLMGLVQINNQISQTKPVQNADFVLDCQFSAIALHPRGVTVDIDIQVFQSGQRCLFARSTYLQRMASFDSPTHSSATQTADTRSVAPLESDAVLRFAKDTGRNYARISGDYNPIHYYRWSARLFGFKSAIAHGMHVLAMAMSRLETHFALFGGAAVITNDFLYPASLPCTTILSSSPFTANHQHTLNFALHDPNATRRKQLILKGEIETS